MDIQYHQAGTCWQPFFSLQVIENGKYKTCPGIPPASCGWRKKMSDTQIKKFLSDYYTGKYDKTNLKYLLTKVDTVYNYCVYVRGLSDSVFEDIKEIRIELLNLIYK